MASETASAAIHDGQRLEQSGDVAAALAAFRRAADEDPGSADAWLEMSRALGRSGDLAGSADALWQAVDARPSTLRVAVADLIAQFPPDSPLIEHLVNLVLARLTVQQPWKANFFIPSIGTYEAPQTSKFMQYSTCSAADFLHPEFNRIVRMIDRTNVFHRKLWEWVYIIHNLLHLGVVAAGTRGLVFGVGQEMLPALFASHGAQITATDAPVDIGEAWEATNQFAAGLSALPEGPLPRAQFEQLVSWEPCDMTAIPGHLTSYDFCWSSCCFEHLGSLRAGMDFVLASVEHCLKPGGTAVHTTELNLSSNDVTIASGSTVLYRRRDVEQLIEELRERGHHVHAFRIAPDTISVDNYVDTPPYAGPHLKLLLEGYVATSVGLVIRKRDH